MMTLREYIDSIGEVLSLNGASHQEVLYFQLYLICLGLDGFKGYGIREARHEEPFCSLGGRLNAIWDYANSLYDSLDETEANNIIEQYLEDEDLGIMTPAEEYQRVFMEVLNSAIRRENSGLELFQPTELTDLVYRLIDYQAGMSIYNPFAGIGSYAGGDNYYGEEMDEITWGIGRLWQWLFDRESNNYVLGDSLSSKWKKKFDIVISTPPMGRMPGSSDTYADYLIKRMPSLLKEDGVGLIVSTGRHLEGRSAKALVDSGMLDAVIMLPRNVFYWTSIPPVILKLRAGRKVDDQIELVDGTSFYKPGGVKSNIIDAGDIFRATIRKDPKVSVTMTAEEIANNAYHLTPMLYLKGPEVNSEGINMMPLSELGSFLKLRVQKEMPETAICTKDMTFEMSKMYEVNAGTLTVNKDFSPKTYMYAILDEPALLFQGIQGRMRFAYVQKAPVFVAKGIIAFQPNEKLVDRNYVAYALSKSDILSRMGTSVIRITEEELSLTRIAVPPLREQKAIVKKVLESEIAQREYIMNGGAEVARKKLSVVLVGSAVFPLSAAKNLSIIKKFHKIDETLEWLQRSAGIDAVIVGQDEEIGGMDIAMLYRGVSPKPLFIISQDENQLEESLGKYADTILPGKCFEVGQEEELVGALITLFDEKDSPAGRLREVYSRQFIAAANLDAKFHFEGIVLESKLEEMLLSKNSLADWRNVLRSIRDNCFLQVLSDYGFLPRNDGNRFKRGAMMDFMVDRVFSPGNGEYYFLEEEILPKELAEMLRSCSSFLNAGSHSFGNADSNTQWTVIHVIMAVICHLDNMLKQGCFDRLDYDTTSARYWSREDNYRFISGKYEVAEEILDDNQPYYYAGNVHLDADICRKESVKPGDIVEISTAFQERHPLYLNRFSKIVFYSKQFHKSKE